MKIPWSKQTFLYITPGIILIWTIYLYFFRGPFYMRNIDPESVYLIDGLSCALLDFNRIGHIGHPGITLKLLSGIFFRFIHLFTGHNDIVTDVISNPELYLSLGSMMLTGITLLLVLRIGMLVYRYTSSILGALVLQASLFYTGVHWVIVSRYTPDRLITIVMLLFFIIYIRHLYDQKFSNVKFSVLSGIVMGAGLVTKFNFIPLLIIPIVLIPGWKNRAYYISSCIGSAFILFLPIFSKLKRLLQDIMEWILHTGLYGSGEQGIIDGSNFLKNIALLFKYNPSFLIIIVMGGFCILILALKPKLRLMNKNGFLFLIASYISIILGLVLIGKHFKNYYALPILGLIPMIFYSIIQLFDRTVRSRYNTLLYTGIFAVLLIFPLISTAKEFTGPNEDLQDKRITEAFIRDQISSNDYFLIAPFWMSNPMPGNDIALGVSWLHHEKLSYLDYERIYPNILTWEGDEKPLKYMRMRVANFEEVLLSGNGIHLYSKPGWNGPELCEFVEQYAQDAGIRVQRDTVYSYAKIEEHIIRYRNIDGWAKTIDQICGFEKQNQGQLYSDSEQILLTGEFDTKAGFSAHGDYSTLLENDIHRSPYYTLNGIKTGDVVSSSVKSNISTEDKIENIQIKCEYIDINGDIIELKSEPSPGRIDEDWFMSDLFAKIESQPADSSLKCYVKYTGSKSVLLDDFTIKVYSQNL